MGRYIKGIYILAMNIKLTNFLTKHYLYMYKVISVYIKIQIKLHHDLGTYSWLFFL